MLRNPTTLSFILGLASLGLVTVACSSSSSGASNNSACDSYANAILDAETKCGESPAVSSDERSNYISRFRTVCTNAIAAPGSGVTANFLSTCAAALSNGASCTSQLPQCVEPSGSLANGTECADDDQCQSGRCEVSDSSTGDGGASASAACGKCIPTIADGAACAPSDTCIKGDQCTSGTCTKSTTTTGGTGPVGSACQSDADCATPNHCDFTQGICAAPGAAGASCFIAADCTTGLICTSGQQCEAPVVSGASCNGGDCASGLGCDATTHKCAAITFAAAGAACDKDAVLCDRGNCNIDGSGGSEKGVCPTIIPDGAACAANSTNAACDDFAECIGGTCQISNPASCK